MIKPGQIYRHCDPRESIRIRITAYRPGDARAQVVDAVTGKRFRQILVKDLHESPVTATGRRRRSGYVLDRDTAETPQEATEGPQEHPEGVSATPAASEAPNGPQRRADGFQGEQQPRGPVDWARHYAERRATARVFAALHRSAEEDVTRVIRLAEQWATRPERADALRELTDALGYNQPAHNAGPSIREAADQDAAHWNDKYAGEGQ